jgi:hypothetical protein
MEPCDFKYCQSKSPGKMETATVKELSPYCDDLAKLLRLSKELKYPEIECRYVLSMQQKDGTFTRIPSIPQHVFTEMLQFFMSNTKVFDKVSSKWENSRDHCYENGVRERCRGTSREWIKKTRFVDQDFHCFDRPLGFRISLSQEQPWEELDESTAPTSIRVKSCFSFWLQCFRYDFCSVWTGSSKEEISQKPPTYEIEVEIDLSQVPASWSENDLALTFLYRIAELQGVVVPLTVRRVLPFVPPLPFQAPR